MVRHLEMCVWQTWEHQQCHAQGIWIWILRLFQYSLDKVVNLLTVIWWVGGNFNKMFVYCICISKSITIMWQRVAVLQTDRLREVLTAAQSWRVSRSLRSANIWALLSANSLPTLSDMSPALSSFPARIKRFLRRRSWLKRGVTKAASLLAMIFVWLVYKNWLNRLKFW